MVVLILEKVPASLRGELSRWMIEPRTGVFVGTVSAMVRDRLWDLAIAGAAKGGSAKGVGGAMLLYSSQTEQGYAVRVWGDTTRDLRDWEGLWLVQVPSAQAAKRGGSSGRGKKAAVAGAAEETALSESKGSCSAEESGMVG